MEQKLNFNKRNATIDGWRGISIILVLLGHYGQSLMIDNKSILYFFAGEGVHIFFIISGYLITYLLLTRIYSEKKEAQPIKKFYLRRFLRILPAFYAFHLVLLALRYANVLDFENILFFKSLLFLTNFNFWGGSWLLGHIWSLAVEEQFYFIWPMLVYYLSFSRLKWLCVGVILLSPLVRTANYLHPAYSDFWVGGFFQHADSIAFGALLSLLVFTNGRESLTRLQNPILIIVLAVLLGSVWWLQHQLLLGIITVPLYYTFFSLFFTLLIQESLHPQALGKFMNIFLTNPVICFIGKISFSVYLWQQLFFSPANTQSVNNTLFFQKAPLNILLLFIPALLSYYGIERTFLRLKEKWEL